MDPTYLRKTDIQNIFPHSGKLKICVRKSNFGQRCYTKYIPILLGPCQGEGCGNYLLSRKYANGNVEGQIITHSVNRHIKYPVNRFAFLPWTIQIKKKNDLFKSSIIRSLAAVIAI